MNTLSKADLERMPGAQIKDLAKRGILRVMSATPIKNLKYTDLPQYRKHAHWKRIEITASEASRLFDVPQMTVSRWAKDNKITVLRRTNREIYLDKADVAYCVEILRERPGAGKWLFNPDRTPFVPVTAGK